MRPTALELLATVLFAVAIAHTFATRLFERLAGRYPAHAGLFHLLGETEVVFGFWAIVFVAAMALMAGHEPALAYLGSRPYTEPLFVFVIMVVAASRPVLAAVRAAIDGVARRLPVDADTASVWLGLAVLPLLGSFVTEPAAMTLAALTLAPRVFRAELPERPKYFALGVLFVNVSIGGTLTAYAAPPVLMVASAWGWDSAYTLAQFGWKAALGVLVNASLATLALRNELRRTPPSDAVASGGPSVPVTVTAVHLGFLGAVIALGHHPAAFVGVFLMFLGYTRAYEQHQGPLVVREALLVAFFLAGLVVLGGMQRWWLQPIVASLSPGLLFAAATALTAVTDNAALTYLGSLVPALSAEARRMLVAGAVAGGGLTVIANAPNPAGAALLRAGFRDRTIGAGALFVAALAPTGVAAVCLLM